MSLLPKPRLIKRSIDFDVKSNQWAEEIHFFGF